MIQINLLPDHLRPIKRTPLPYLVAIAILLAAVGGMFSIALKQRAELSSTRATLASEEKALADLQSIVNEANELTAQKLALSSKIDTIQEILQDRIVWSQQLDRLTKLAPENIWFRDIKVVMDTFSDEVVEMDPKTNQPIVDPRTGQVKRKRQRVRKPVLQVSGYVINDEQGQSVVHPFVEQTDDDPEFSKQFTLLPSRLEDTEFAGFPVRGFTLTYLINPRGSL